MHTYKLLKNAHIAEMTQSLVKAGDTTEAVGIVWPAAEPFFYTPLAPANSLQSH